MRTIAIEIVCLLVVSVANAEDWPTYRHDNRRSGVTSAALRMPLKLLWQRKALQPPLPAWTRPAHWDAFAENKGLQPQRDFDLAYYTTSVDGRLYFGSSVDNAVHCIEASSGKQQWVFFTGGAVRLPPTIHDKKAYFGSDDGHAYCVDTSSGKLVWKLRGGPSDTLIPSNGKLLSLWPCRTGLLIDGPNAYCAFSLLPWKESFLCAISANDGRLIYRRSSKGNTFQGPLAAGERLVAMQGKAPPLAFDPAGGNVVASYDTAGGVRCTLIDDKLMATGPANQKSPDNVVLVVDLTTRKVMSGFIGADRLLVDGRFGYLHLKDRLLAIDRVEHFQLSLQAQELSQRRKALLKQKNADAHDAAIETIDVRLTEIRAAMAKTAQWKLPIPPAADIIKAGSLLFVGGEDQVSAVDAEAGKIVWTAKVDGRARGLTVADGRLFVSTELGHIYAFTSAEQ